MRVRIRRLARLRLAGLGNPGTPPEHADFRAARIDFSLPTAFQVSPSQLCWRAPLARTSEIRLLEHRRTNPPLPSALRRHRLLWPLLTSRSGSAPSPFQAQARSPQVRTRFFPTRPPDLRRLTFDHEGFAESCPLALIGTALYPVLVHRPMVSLHAPRPSRAFKRAGGSAAKAARFHPPHGWSPFRSCASLRSLWPAHERTCTSKIAPLLGAHEHARISRAFCFTWNIVYTAGRKAITSAAASPRGGTCHWPLHGPMPTSWRRAAPRSPRRCARRSVHRANN